MSKKKQIKLQRRIQEIEKRLPVNACHPIVFYSAFLCSNPKAVEQLAPYFDSEMSAQNRKIGLSSIYISALIVLMTFYYSFSASGIVLLYDRLMMVFAGVFLMYSAYKTYCYFNSKCFWELYSDACSNIPRTKFISIYEKACQQDGKENLGELNQAFRKFLK